MAASGSEPPQSYTFDPDRPPRPVNTRSDAPVPTDTMIRMASPPRTLAEVEQLIEQLQGTAWEFIEETGRAHRFDFRSDSAIAIYQTRAPGAQAYQVAKVTELSASQSGGNAFIRTRQVTSGQSGVLRIEELTEDSFALSQQYAPSGAAWQFKKLGQAQEAWPEGSPKPLGDGYWKASFSPVRSAAQLIRQHRLQDVTEDDDQPLATLAIAGVKNAGFLIGDENDADCKSGCTFIVNDRDPRTGRLRRRLIEATGVTAIGVRIEQSNQSALGREANAVSLRAFDEQGDWDEWRCTSLRGILDCRSKSSSRAQL